MRSYKESDIFKKMNKNNGITSQIAESVKSIDEGIIINRQLQNSLSGMSNAFKDTISTKVVNAVKNHDILICVFRLDKRLPANMPFVKVKRNQRACVIVDLSKYVITKQDDTGKIIEASCDSPKILYSILVPALLSLEVINENIVPPLEVVKELSIMWATMFNKILKSQRIFIASEERYDAFMYLAMKFFMIYYYGLPDILITKVTTEFLGGVKSPYIQFIEGNLERKNINLYQDWNTFASTIFSNEVTNITSLSGGLEMNTEHYIKLFSNYMGRDGAYMALWSADYFFFCIFSAYEKSYILNDRNWDEIVNRDNKSFPRLLSALYKAM